MLYKESLLCIILTSDIIYFSPIIKNMFSTLDNKGSLLLKNNNFIKVKYISIYINNLP